MVSEYTDIKHDFKTVFIVSIVLLVVLVISGYALTAGRGVEDQTFVLRFTIYSLLGGGGLLFFFVVNLYNYMTHTRPVKTILHEIEEMLLMRRRHLKYWAAHKIAFQRETEGLENIHF